MKKRMIYFFLGIPFQAFFTFSQINFKNQEIIVNKYVASKNAHITYVTVNETPCIVKQKRDKTKIVIAAIREALAAHIAEDFNIAHSVEIISMKDDVPGKIYPHFPATLHTIVPGKIAREVPGKYSQLCIKQRCPKIKNRWFDEIIVDQMTWHRHLPIIVALDIFFCNTDRHRGNLLYDEKTDSFWAIDMDNIYRRNLPLYAYENLKKMITIDKKKFTHKEIEAFRVVKKTLEFLLQKHSPDSLIALLHTFAHQTGYVDNGLAENNKIKRKMNISEQIITESYGSARKLVKMLDKVINDFHVSNMRKVNYKNQDIIVEKCVESKNSLISYVTIHKFPYIIKQKKDKSKVTVSAIRDAFAAHIASDFHIAHSVEIISKKNNVSGKTYKDLPATLHTIAPGTMIYQVNGKYSQLCIKQRCPKTTNRWFDEIIVDQITWHKDLPVIVALDIFLCNRGRHNKNLFYDEKTDSFCAIDMDNIYKVNLPLYACANVERMIKDKKKFTQQEIEALKVIKKTLLFLLQKYSPDNLISLLHIFANQTGYIDDGSLENERIKKSLKSYEKVIIESYVSSYKLVKIVDKVINNSHA